MEYVQCNYCGKTLLKDQAIFCEDAGIYVCPDCADEHLVECERCGTLMDRDNAYRGFDGFLCECCHDDLFS